MSYSFPIAYCTSQEHRNMVFVCDSVNTMAYIYVYYHNTYMWKSSPIIVTEPSVQELMPVYRQSARMWLFKSSPSSRLPLLSTRPAVMSPSQSKNVTEVRPVPNYTAWLQRHIDVNNLPKVATQLCPGGNWTHDLLIASPTPYRTATPLHIHIIV